MELYLYIAIGLLFFLSLITLYTLKRTFTLAHSIDESLESVDDSSSSMQYSIDQSLEAIDECLDILKELKWSTSHAESLVRFRMIEEKLRSNNSEDAPLAVTFDAKPPKRTRRRRNAEGKLE